MLFSGISAPPGGFRYRLAKHVAVRLIAILNFEHHAVLVLRRVNGGSPCWTVGVIQGAFDLLIIEPERGGFLAIDYQASAAGSESAGRC